MADHPFVAVASLAQARGLPEIALVVEQDGTYVRLDVRGADLLIKRDSDPGSNIDRIGFSYHDRVDIEEAEIARGAEALLELICEHARKAVPDWPVREQANAD